MAEFQKVRGSHEISIRAADLLEDMRPQDYNGSNRAKTVRTINDILQGRAQRTVDSFLLGLRNTGGVCYAQRVGEVCQDVQAFLSQKALLSQPYTKTSKKQYKYQDLRAETIRVIQGTSRLNVDLLNSIVAETTAQIKELEQQIKTAETELHELTHGAEQARQDYAQLMSWAGLYDKCTFEAKKMIAAQFIKTVHIKRDYEIEIEFNVAFTEFQKIYLEPEPEESKRKRSATTILALAETTGQAV